MGGRERGGRKPTDTSASKSRNGTQEYRSEKDIRERDKGFYRGQLERTGTEYSGTGDKNSVRREDRCIRL